MSNQPCVYIMTNKRNGTLYTGVTRNLEQRVKAHKQEINEGFTKKYKLYTLVYYEFLDTVQEAIAREKQIKAGSRQKKLALIEKDNPQWSDLAAKW